MKPDWLQGQGRSSGNNNSRQRPSARQPRTRVTSSYWTTGPGLQENQLLGPMGANILWLHSLPWHLPRWAKKLVWVVRQLETEHGLSRYPVILRKEKKNTTNLTDVTNIIRENYEELDKFEILLKGEKPLKVTKRCRKYEWPCVSF